MSHAHAVYDAMDKFKEILNNFIKRNGPAILEYDALKSKIDEIKRKTNYYNNLYVQALLYKGVVFSSFSVARVFTYNDTQVSSWANFFNLSDTLKTVYRVINIAHPSGFKPKGYSWDLCKVEEYQKIIDILPAMRLQLETMEANFPLIANASKEELEFATVLSFDHTYSYSDDNGVWRAGADAHKKATALVQEALAKNPDLIKVVKEVSGYLKLNESFFTG